MRIGSLSVFDDYARRVARRIEATALEKERPGWQGSGAEARMRQRRATDRWSKNLHGDWGGSSLLGLSASMTHEADPDTL
ncbi:hypothetical protein [Glutamicibacter mysorens]|uniref:hypothetical protein n=1 Tax=Glutamicibacter mysorens TaxID=257984 RepID=UPI0012EDC611|nr:hypothetical protein [Glutamicibacter mysorens]